MDNLLNKQIIISGIEQKLTANGKTFYKVKDESNTTYQLWQTKQDGTNSAAYQGLTSLPNNGLNQSVQIGYREQQGEFNGKPVTYRSIVTIKPVAMQPAAKITNQAKGRVEQKDEEDKWKEISYGKCKHAYLVEAFKKLDLQALLNEPTEDIERLAEQWADMSMRKLSQELSEPEYPEEQGHVEDLGEEIQGIPF